MRTTLKILMLEDQEDDAGLIERVLQKEGINYVRKRVDTQGGFIEALSSFQPDVILSDHALPQFNSIEALRWLKHEEITTPFILVTGAVSEEFAVNCLKLGADDYLLKSNLSRLPSAINNALKQYEIEQKRKKAEQNLRRQNEELVKINRELDNFVYSVSHNLRAPLLSVLGLIQLASRDDTNKQFSTYWDMIAKSIHKLDETVKEILDYSRNSRSEIKLEKVQLEDMIQEALEKLKYLEDFDRITFAIKVNLDSDFYSDPFRLSVILTNLLSNSVKYRNPYVSSFVSVLASVGEKEAILKISDNGIGIDNTLQPKIFEMFFRATERSEGAGLGLYIVKEAIEKLHGSIKVDSKAGESTVFTISIPNRHLRA